jgi:hypothetical protein
MSTTRVSSRGDRSGPQAARYWTERGVTDRELSACNKVRSLASPPRTRASSLLTISVISPAEPSPLTCKWSGDELPNPIADSELPKWTLPERSVARSPGVGEVRSPPAPAAESEDPRATLSTRQGSDQAMCVSALSYYRWR